MFTDCKADAEAMDLDESSDDEHEEPDLPATPVQQLGKDTSSKPLLLVILWACSDRLLGVVVDVLGVILLASSHHVRIEMLRKNKALAKLQLSSQTSVAVVLCLSPNVRLLGHVR